MKVLILLPFLMLAGCAVPVAAPEAAAAPEPAAVPAAAPAVSAAALPAGGRLVSERCSACHSLEIAMSGPRTAGQWQEVLQAMVDHGLVATDEELRLMHSYLAEVR